MPVAKQTVYTNADRSELAEEGTPGALLLAREGAFISEVDAKQFKVKTDEDEVYDAVADHEAKHGGETEEQARAARQRMLEGQPDPDGPAVEGERSGVKASAPKENKAVKNAPDNKGG
jgi:hypothetical protein